MSTHPKFGRIEKNYVIICTSGGVYFRNINPIEIDNLFENEEWDVFHETNAHEFDMGADEFSDIYDILVHTGIFKSKGDARKNWVRTGKEIPWGFNDFENIGKLRHRITIYKPFDVDKFKLNEDGGIKRMTEKEERL